MNNLVIAAGLHRQRTVAHADGDALDEPALGDVEHVGFGDELARHRIVGSAAGADQRNGGEVAARRRRLRRGSCGH